MFPCHCPTAMAAVFFPQLSWTGFVAQLAGTWSRVPWPTRDFNGGGQTGVQRRLRLLDSTWGLVEIPSRKRCAGSGIAWVQVLRADTPQPAGFIHWNSSRGHSTVLGLSMHGNSCAPCCLEYGARPLPQCGLGWAHFLQPILFAALWLLSETRCASITVSTECYLFMYMYIY